MTSMHDEREQAESGRGRAEACANIALAKYWGKSALGDNLTDVPSLSLTLDALRTRTEVRFLDEIKQDRITMGGHVVQGAAAERVTKLLDRMRNLTGERRCAEVTSRNNFPTAAGLASSASGFAALSVAAAAASGAALSPGQLSSQARKGSASAARSIFEGFSVLEREADEALPLFARDHWQVAMVVAVVGAGRKPIGSTAGMLHTQETSPYYPAWRAEAPQIYSEIKSGVAARDFEKVALWIEHSTRMMHATMMTSVPPVVYFKGPTVELMHEIALKRSQGEPVAYTMDAGPNVKVFTLESHIERTAEFLRSFPGVERVLVCRPGPAASQLSCEGELTDAARLDSEDMPAFFHLPEGQPAAG